MENNPVKELELYIIRHGQSTGNAGYGRDDLTIKEANDPYLTEKGVSQAQAAGKYLSSTDFDAVYSSALLRAVQTANEIIKAQPSEKVLYIQPLLTEMGVQPEYKGAGMEEITGICPTAQLAEGLTENDPLVFHNPGSDEDGLFERAEKIIAYLRERYKNGEKVAVVN
ncbi:MAG: histidine phosphatase family protein, partial [Clostridia bacterium]|nr:histidine phosphatase family protein [Clostridia bacterium]